VDDDDDGEDDDDEDDDDDDDDGQSFIFKKNCDLRKNSFIELFHLVIIFDEDVGGKKQ